MITDDRKSFGSVWNMAVRPASPFDGGQMVTEYETKGYDRSHHRSEKEGERLGSIILWEHEPPARTNNPIGNV